MTYKYRIRFSKLGRAVWLGHLEVTDLIRRACRALDWPLKYSEGFHPLPRVSMGDALSVGVESKAEFFDVEMISQPQVMVGAGFSPRLNAQAEACGYQIVNFLPVGVSFTNSWPLRSDAPSIQEGIGSYIYRVELPHLSKFVGMEMDKEIKFVRKEKQIECRFNDHVDNLAVMGDDVVELEIRNKIPRLKVGEILKYGFELSDEDVNRAILKKTDVVWRDDGK